MRVPASGMLVGEREKELMHAAVDDLALTIAGDYNAMFEEDLVKFIGCKYALTTNSGSSANLLALSALTSSKHGEEALQPGDEVICVAASFPTTINPIIQLGCIPVFIDITFPTLNVNVSQLEQALTDKTAAVMIAHTLGNPFNIDAVKDFCNANDLWLIEDCCDALGSTWNGQHVGTFGDVATLSFYPAHHITMGEGGSVFTNSRKLAKIVESIRDWGRDCWCAPGKDNTCKKRFQQQHGSLPYGYDHKYTYSELGYNLKITDVQAACGVAQLERLPEFIAARRDNHAYLHEHLRKFPLILPGNETSANPSWFGFSVTVMNGERRKLIQHLEQKGIATRLLFGSDITAQPYMAGRRYECPVRLDRTQRVTTDTFWIGCWPGLTPIHLDWIISAFQEFYL